MAMIVFIMLLNVGCDQISKNLVRSRVAYYEEISIMTPYVTLTKVENTGAFLSVGHTLPQPLRTILLTVLPVLALAFAFGYLFWKNHLSLLSVLAICFIVGGGIGNVYDRVVYGSVTDFLHIDFVLFQTGIFNMADVSIMVGAGIMILDFARKMKTAKPVQP